MVAPSKRRGYDVDMFVNKQEAQEFKCGLCLMIMRTPTTIACGHEHSFCASCIADWEEQAPTDAGGNRKCPLCGHVTDPDKKERNVDAEADISLLRVNCPVCKDWQGYLRNYLRKHSKICKVNGGAEEKHETLQFCVIIKTLDGRHICVNDMKSNDTVTDFKKRIELQEGIDADKQRLVYHGRNVIEQKKGTDQLTTLRDYGIRNGSAVHLIVVGGSKEKKKDNRAAIRNFAKSCRLEDYVVETANDFKLVLQTAMKIELSTLPLYLSGYYSFKSKIGRTADKARKMLRSIIMEEMKHMEIINNIMISLWGNNATVMPKNGVDHEERLIGSEYDIDFSGSLPGGIRPDIKPLDGYPSLLNRCSKDQVYHVYIKIEEPENHKEKSGRMNVFIPDHGKTSVVVDFEIVSKYKTIGQFYKILMEGMHHLHKTEEITFHKDKAGYKQLTTNSLGAPEIKDLDSANKALQMIIDEGEGLPQDGVNYTRQKSHAEEKSDGSGENKASHFIRFVQLLTGLKVMKMTGERVVHTYPPIIRYTIEYETDDNGNLKYPYKYDDEKDLLSYKYWTRQAKVILKNELNKKYSQLLHSLTQSMRDGDHISGTTLDDMKGLVDAFEAVIKHKELTFPTFTYDGNLVDDDNKDDETVEIDELFAFLMERDSKNSDKLQNIKLTVIYKNYVETLRKRFSGDDHVSDIAQAIIDKEIIDKAIIDKPIIDQVTGNMVGRMLMNLYYRGKTLEMNQLLSSIEGIRGNAEINSPIIVAFKITGIPYMMK